MVTWDATITSPAAKHVLEDCFALLDIAILFQKAEALRLRISQVQRTVGRSGFYRDPSQETERGLVHSTQPHQPSSCIRGVHFGNLWVFIWDHNWVSTLVRLADPRCPCVGGTRRWLNPVPPSVSSFTDVFMGGSLRVR
ncbi:hypothetical protein RRG08_012142 [Elysia crispata]|uniref:Uncharacterized protein n=1 Tax=Elysia crispata TaxID=231223 RepID=A0AAE1ABT3_9GAST|nr:hypothetical protein RRG08_012142 [Elysia crispata]